MSDQIRVVIVDDQLVARSFFEFQIGTSDKYRVIASLPSARDAVDLCGREAVDLIIMDIMMRSGIDGLSAAIRIKESHPETKIILVTSMAESSWEQRARSAGVESFWYKEYSREPLLEVMDRTMAGDTVYSGISADVPFGIISRSQLTERELDVLRELTAGGTNEEIAEALGISVNTVRRHIQNLLAKTGFSNRLELAIRAARLGLVVSDQSRKSGER